jgi:hypothetical protein
MLPQMLHPALGYEHLDVASRIARIGEVLPEQRAIAPADMPCGQKTEMAENTVSYPPPV